MARSRQRRTDLASIAEGDREKHAQPRQNNEGIDCALHGENRPESCDNPCQLDEQGNRVEVNA